MNNRFSQLVMNRAASIIVAGADPGELNKVASHLPFKSIELFSVDK